MKPITLDDLTIIEEKRVNSVAAQASCRGKHRTQKPKFITLPGCIDSCKEVEFQ